MARKTVHNKLTTPEDIEKISSENKRLIKDFLMYLKGAQRAESTIHQYESDLNIFFVWNMKNNDNKPFVSLSKRAVVAFQTWLIYDNSNSPKRVKRIKSVLSSLSNYIENVLDDLYEGYRPIVRKIEDPVNQFVREKTVLSEEQVNRLLDILVEKQEYKKACVFALAAFSGRRKSELLRFKVSHFTDECLVCEGALYRTPEKIKTKGRGLGKMLYCYTLAKQFKPYLDLWMNYRQENDIESEWLFPSPLDPTQPMNISTLNSYAETFTKLLGVDVYLHSLRHFYTTYLAKNGIPNSVIKEIIGWESEEMCSVYTDIDSEELISSYFNKDGIVNKEKKSLSDL